MHRQKTAFIAFIVVFLGMALQSSAAKERGNPNWIESVPHELAAGQIGLPTGGVSVQSCVLVPAEGEKHGYCRVLGSIIPVDPGAPAIEFQVNLPQKWNHKAVQFGGGGFNGSLVTAEGVTVGQEFDGVPPLQQGYVTFGSDGGHKSAGWDSRWAMNDEALRNFAHEQLKKTRDAAIAIATAYYGEKPRKVYFIGGSNGGREALMAIQRYPDDYDGAVAYFPVLNWIAKAVKDNSDAANTLAAGEAGWIDNAAYETIKAEVYKTVGAPGGLGGVIGDPVAADRLLKKIMSGLSGRLPKEQIEVWGKLMADQRLEYPLADGFSVMPGYSVSQLVIDSISRPNGDIPCNLFGSAPGKRDGAMMQFSDGVLKYQVVRREDFNPADYAMSDWKEETVAASRLLNATNPELSRFSRHGGKLIMLHGTADQVVAVRGSIDYFNNVRNTMGAENAEKFMRFYIVPGYGHGGGSVFTMGRDVLADLDAWVLDGKAPEKLLVTDQNEATHGRTQVLSPYRPSVLASASACGTAMPLVIQEQGGFAVGGTTVEHGGEFDMAHCLSPEGQTAYGDHLYAFYQIPVNARKFPMVFQHGGQSSKRTWETTPDGREGFQNIFLRRSFSVYLVDQPRRGEAGVSTKAPEPDAVLGKNPVYGNRTLHTLARLGEWPDLYPGSQFPKGAESLNQILRTVTPDTGPLDFDVAADAMGKLLDKIGPSILVTHSQGGTVGWRAALRSDNVKAIVAYEPGGSPFLFPEGETPEPVMTTFGPLAPLSVPVNEFEKLARIPIIIYYGDNIATEPVKDAGRDQWRGELQLARAFAACVNRHGGDAQVVHLPEMGITGNTHFLMSDLNNVELAELLLKWLSEKGLDKK